MTADGIPLPLVDAALAYRAAGLSPIATHDKRFVGRSWTPYKTTPADDCELGEMFVEASQVAVICGAVSGCLECLDFDDGGSAWPAWAAIINQQLPGLLAKLYMEITPRGGRHLVYRIYGMDVPPRKLHAGRPGPKKVEVLIETR